MYLDGRESGRWRQIREWESGAFGDLGLVVGNCHDHRSGWWWWCGVVRADAEWAWSSHAAGIDDLMVRMEMERSGVEWRGMEMPRCLDATAAEEAKVFQSNGYGSRAAFSGVGGLGGLWMPGCLGCFTAQWVGVGGGRWAVGLGLGLGGWWPVDDAKMYARRL